MKICSKPNHFPVKWLCTAGFRAKKLIFVVGLKVLQKMGNPKLFYIWGKNVEKILATSWIQFQTGMKSVLHR